MAAGWCPFATHRPFPERNYAKGNKGRKAVCLHIMDGPFRGSIDWMRKMGTSTHFCISKRGELEQLVSIWDTAYTNGLSYDHERDVWISPRDQIVVPTWPLIEAPINPNFQTITFEHEGRPGDPLTAAMQATQIRALRWVADETGLVYEPEVTLIGHYQLDPIGRARCPGPAFDFVAIAAKANGRDDFAALWGDAFPYRPHWRIPGAWRRHALTLGKATSAPMTDNVGATWQHFENGAVRFSEATGAVVYLAEGS